MAASSNGANDQAAPAGPSARGDRLRDHLRRHGWVEAVVTGDSMRPTLAAGDVVRLVTPERVRPGDILAFEHSGGLLVHRVVTRTPEGFVCRGDNRVVADGPTRFDEVIGCAISVRSPCGGPPRRLAGGFCGRVLPVGRFAARRAREVARRLTGEVRLLRSQARGETPVWRREDLSTRWPGSTKALLGGDLAGHEDGDRPHVLQVSEIEGTSASPVVATSTPLLVIAADTYCSLPPQARRALVRSRLAQGAQARRTVVVAFARTRRARLARSTALVRRVLAAARVPAGEPGDAVVARGATRHLSYTRFFAAPELTDDLAEAGAEVVALESICVRGVDLWQAEVRSSSGTR